MCNMLALNPLEVLLWPFVFLWERLVKILIRLLTGTMRIAYPFGNWVDQNYITDWLRIAVFLVVGVGAYFFMPPMLLASKLVIVVVAWIVGISFAAQKTVVGIANTGSYALYIATYDVLVPALLGVMIATPFVH